VTLLLLNRLQRAVVRWEWNAGTSGAAATGGTNQFLFLNASTTTPTANEDNSRRRSGVAARLWRLAAGFTSGAPTSQATVTARINGVSQASTATVIGTALGITATTLAASIAVVGTDNLSILFVTTSTDTGATHPVAQLVGVLNDSF